MHLSQRFVRSLATAAADAGRSVLLVEADMRAPQLGDAFGVPPRVVLQDVLEGRAGPQAALIRLDAPGVDVIAAGPASCYVLPVERLTALAVGNPSLHARLLRNIMRGMADRLRRATDEIRALED